MSVDYSIPKEEYQALVAENKKLRGLMSVTYSPDEVSDLMAENAKLRELVRDFRKYRDMYFTTGIYPEDHGVLDARARELGVEVD